MDRNTALKYPYELPSNGPSKAPSGKIVRAAKASSVPRHPRLSLVKPTAVEPVNQDTQESRSSSFALKSLLAVVTFSLATAYGMSKPGAPPPVEALARPVARKASGNEGPTLVQRAKAVASHYRGIQFQRAVYLPPAPLFAPKASTEGLKTEKPKRESSRSFPATTSVQTQKAQKVSTTPGSLHSQPKRKATESNRSLDLSKYSPPLPSVSPSTLALRVEKIIEYHAPKHSDAKLLAKRIVSESLEQGYDPLFVAAVIKSESGFNSLARSHVGARGLMQIMPQTGRYLAGKHNIKKVQLYDTEQNLKLGISFLKELEAGYGGDKVMTLVAYNWGPGHVQSAGNGKRRIPGEVMRYAVKILNDYRRWRGDVPVKSALG